MKYNFYQSAEGVIEEEKPAKSQKPNEGRMKA
jgi:hypothetical protein